MTTNPDPTFDIPDIDLVVQMLDAVLAEMNVGLLVYHLEDPNDAGRLKLVYANKEASRYTGADLQRRVGRYILDAFPALAETDLPQTYAEVARTRAPRELGAVEYEDEDLAKSFYSVKAFPMPNDCVGVAFENIALRKQVDAMVKHLAEKLRKQNKDWERLATTISEDLQATAHDLLTHGETLQQNAGDQLPAADRALLDHLVATSNRLTGIVDRLVAHTQRRD